MSNTSLLTLQSNGASNNGVFIDNSRFNNIINKNGNTTQGTFSPYGDNWSVCNSGNGNGLIAAYNSAMQIGTGQFTIEAWVYPTGTQSTSQTIFSNRTYNSTGGGTFSWYINATTNTLKLDEVQTPTTITTSTLTVTPNAWQHIAITRDSSNYVRMFINGVLANNPVQSTFNFNSTNNFEIGFNNDASHYSLIGYISNLRFVVGQALYTGAFTPSTSPLTATSVGTSGANVASSITGKAALLACQSPRFIDNSPVNSTVTVYGTPSVQKFSPFSTVTVPRYYSTYFDGTGDYLTVPSGTAFNIGSGNYTVEAWIYKTSSNRLMVLAIGGNGLSVAINTSGDIEVCRALLAIDYTFTANIVNNVWTHIAVSRTGSSLTAYKNGTLLGTQSTNATYGQGICYIGSDANSTDTHFSGYISNFRLIKGQGLYTASFTPSTTPLTAVSNTSLLTCQDSTLKDNSTNNFTITANGDTKPLPVSPFTPTASSPTSYSPTVFGGSMYFDGTGDYLTSPYNLGYELTSGDFTIELWVYRMAAGVQHYLIHNRPTSSSVGWGTDITSTNTINFYYTGAGSLTGTSTVPINTWTHIAFCKSGTTLRIFNNGVLDASSSSIGTGSVSTGTNLFIGCDNGPSFAAFFNGYISDLKITKGASLYNANFYPGSSPSTSISYINNRTDLANTAQATLLLSGTSTGIIDQTRTVNLETFGDAKVVQGVSPYSGSYYSTSHNGSTDWITYGSTTFGTNAFTIEFWVFTNTIPSNAMLVCQPTNGGLQIQTSGADIDIGTFGVSATIATSGGPFVTGKWLHVVAVRSGTGTNQASIFVNGTRYANGTVSTNFVAGNLQIGGISTQALNGYISNVRVINGAALYDPTLTTLTVPTGPLSTVANTVLLTCQNNKFVDNSSSAFTATLSGTPKIATQNPFQVNTGQSYYFDGTGDYMYNPGSTNLQFGTGDYTIEYWINPTSFAGTPVHIDFRTSNGATGGAIQIYTTTGGVITVYGGSSTATLLVTGSTLKLGEWTHVSLVRQSGVGTTLYINGSRQGSTVVDSTSYGLGSLWLGATASAGGNFTTGYITDLRITKGTARYTSNNTTYLNSGSPYMTK